MRAVWPFGRPYRDDESQAALDAANASHEQAVTDRVRMSATRAEADTWAALVRGHNSANRYDDWLRQVMRGDQL